MTAPIAKHSLLALALLCACGGSDSAAPSSKPTSAADGGADKHHAQATSAKKDSASGAQPRSFLQWKRGVALEADLSRALELPADSLCREFGTASCIREVHLVPLGGSNPFTTGMFEPAAEPLASTPTVIDRVVLSACAQRVELDREAGRDRAKVFRQLSLGDDAETPTREESHALVRELFQRFLARDPSDSELETIAALAHADADQTVSASDFAKLACFSIGSSAEFLFF